MSKIHVAGMEDHEKFDAKTFDPWKGQKLSFVDVWLAENPDYHNVEEARDAEEEAARIAKTASESGIDLYQGFETELAEIESKPYDEVVKEQSSIELNKNTFKDAPRAAKPTFFPDF